jgi:hypothetical protein
MAATELHPDQAFISAGPTTGSSVMSTFITNYMYRYSANGVEILYYLKLLYTYILFQLHIGPVITNT